MCYTYRRYIVRGGQIYGVNYDKKNWWKPPLKVLKVHSLQDVIQIHIVHLRKLYTDKKENEIVLIYKEIQRD